MNHGVWIKPTVDMTRVVRVKAAGSFTGAIDTSAITFTGSALDFDGDDNADSVKPRLHEPTYFDAYLKGATGAGTGTAIKLHSDNLANAWLMGVIGRGRIYGFEKGIWLRQTSTDLTQFVNANNLDFHMTRTVTPLYMESSHSLGYGLDGNNIRIAAEPLELTTTVMYSICGQSNVMDLQSDGIGTTQAVIAANTRNSLFTLRITPAEISNLSTDDLVIITPNDDGCITATSLKATTSGLKIRECDLILDNNKYVQCKRATDGGTTNVLGMSSNDDTLLQSSSTAGDSILINVRNSTGTISFQLNNGTTAARIQPTKAFQNLGPHYHATPAGSSQTASSMYAGSGAPSATDGANGDFYFRSDGVAGTAIYQKRAGAWVGIV
jgi:hypothetical protein